MLSMSQENPILIEVVRKLFIWPPSPKNYSLQWPEKKEQSMGQAQFVRQLLKDKVKVPVIMSSWTISIKLQLNYTSQAFCSLFFMRPILMQL